MEETFKLLVAQPEWYSTNTNEAVEKHILYYSTDSNLESKCFV